MSLIREASYTVKNAQQGVLRKCFEQMNFDSVSLRVLRVHLVFPLLICSKTHEEYSEPIQVDETDFTIASSPHYCIRIIQVLLLRNLSSPQVCRFVTCDLDVDFNEERRKQVNFLFGLFCMGI